MAISTIGQEGLSSSAQYTGFKNRIINGDMRIDQRNAGAAVTSDGSSYKYAVDRFGAYGDTGDGVFTVQQSSAAPTGFNKSIKITVTTADASLSAINRYFVRQCIEGYNVADFGFGTATASTMTLSFWVRSSITGQHSGSILNDNFDRAYPYTFTINAADTWEYKTVIIAGDITGTWLKDNNAGMSVIWNLGAGSSRVGTAGVWQTPAMALFGATGSVNVMGTNGATFYITGVQLEKGSVATAFDYRPYGTELQLCQRYYEQMTADSTQSIGGYGRTITGGCGGNGVAYGTYTFPVVKRTAPTLVYSGTFRLQISAGSDTNNTTSLSLSESRPYSATVFMNSGGGGTAGYHGVYQFMTSTSYIGFNSEL